MSNADDNMSDTVFTRLIPAQAIADYVALLIDESQADDDGTA